MLDFALSIAEFALHAAVILVCIIVVIGFIASIVSKNKDTANLKITNLNKKLTKNRMALLKSQLSKKDFKKALKDHKTSEKKKMPTGNVYVIEFEGDIKASATEHLREEISAVLSVATKADQVVVKVESPGGMVHGYGLAASQLQRIRDAEIPLTVCVDKIAASGGYMMASIANNIVAAPFAIIGSIGVVAALPNFHKVLKKHDVDYLEITAGEFKRTLTPLGEVTDPKVSKFKEQIEDVHELFKNHVIKYRKQLDLGKVATGEYWYGEQAKNLNLVDQLGTSDEFLIKLAGDHKILEVKHQGKKSLQEKLNESLSAQVEQVFYRVSNLLWKQRYQ